jgi:mannosyltransferase
VPIENNSADNLQLIVPNLHRRYSGVTATNRMVAPKLARHVPRGMARFRCARRHRADGHRGSC